MIFFQLRFLGSSERAKLDPTGNDSIHLGRDQRSPQRPRNEPQAGNVEHSLSELHYSKELKKKPQRQQQWQFRLTND